MPKHGNFEALREVENAIDAQGLSCVPPSAEDAEEAAATIRVAKAIEERALAGSDTDERPLRRELHEVKEATLLCGVPEDLAAEDLLRSTSHDGVESELIVVSHAERCQPTVAAFRDQHVQVSGKVLGKAMKCESRGVGQSAEGMRFEEDFDVLERIEKRIGRRDLVDLRESVQRAKKLLAREALEKETDLGQICRSRSPAASRGRDLVRHLAQEEEGAPIGDDVPSLLGKPRFEGFPQRQFSHECARYRYGLRP